MNRTRAEKKRKGKIMKKIVLMMVAMMSMTVAFAGNEFGDENKTAKKADAMAVADLSSYNMTVDYSKLARVLRLSEDQILDVMGAHNHFVRDMRKAGTAEASEREGLVKKAADKELGHMRRILDRNQYATYEALINATLANRGLIK